MTLGTIELPYFDYWIRILSEEAKFNPKYQSKFESAILLYTRRMNAGKFSGVGYTRTCIQMGAILCLAPDKDSNSELEQEWTLL